MGAIFTLAGGAQWFIEDAPENRRSLATALYYGYLLVPLVYGLLSLWLAGRLGVPGRSRTYWGTVAFNATATLILLVLLLPGNGSPVLIPLIFHSVMTVLILLPSSRAFHTG